MDDERAEAPLRFVDEGTPRWVRAELDGSPSCLISA